MVGLTLAGVLIALPLCLYWPNVTTWYVAGAVVTAATITGIIWATRIWKKHGTLNWLSRIHHID